MKHGGISFDHKHKCELCKDGGMNGGYSDRDYWYPFGICACPAGERLRKENPRAADEANEQRANLIGKR